MVHCFEAVIVLFFYLNMHAVLSAVQRCSSPKYLATIGFSDDGRFSPMSQIKVTVYCVRERLTHTVVHGIISYTR